MIRKFKFYLDDKESEIYEYDTNTYIDNEDLMSDMENDRNDWVYSVIDTGYIEIKPNIYCNNCNWNGFEEELLEYNETSKVDNTTLEFVKGCPNCKTDEYLINI